MQISEFLKHSRQQLVTCLPDNSLGSIARLMYTHSIGAMPVCEPGGRMVGIGTRSRTGLRKNRPQRTAISAGARPHDDTGHNLQTR